MSFGFGPAGPGVPGWMTPGFNPALPHPLARPGPALYDPRLGYPNDPRMPVRGPAADAYLDPRQMQPPYAQAPRGGLDPTQRETVAQTRTTAPMGSPKEPQGGLWDRLRTGVGQLPEKLGRQGPYGWQLSPEEARGRFWGSLGQAGAAMLAQQGRAAAAGREAGLAEMLGAGAPAYFGAQRQGVADIYGARERADQDAMQQELMALQASDPDYMVKAARAVMPYDPGLASRIIASTYRGRGSWVKERKALPNNMIQDVYRNTADPTEIYPVGQAYPRWQPQQPKKPPTDAEIDASTMVLGSLKTGAFEDMNIGDFLSMESGAARHLLTAVQRKSDESEAQYRERLRRMGIPEQVARGVLEGHLGAPPVQGEYPTEQDWVREFE